MALRKLPIGIQDFVSLRTDGYLYVDKTALIHRLVTDGKVYFLSRPRRFGKSLLCSTLGAYWEGRRELFAGLAIEQLEQDWTPHPVLRLDLNAEKYDSPQALEAILDRHLIRWEAQYGSPIDKTLFGRFMAVIEQAHRATGQRVAVIIDEYDKPLLATLDNPALNHELRQILKPFFGCLKSSDAHLKFVFITGVTKFGQVSVFSDLNQLQDLSLHPVYATLCGITEEELLATFGPEMEKLATAQGLSAADCLAVVRRQYNGYHFHHAGESVYNPFSTLNVFSTREFADYWFQTGTPTFLVELLKATDTDLREIDGVELEASDFANYRADPDRPLPVLYQSGYLTIKGYDPEVRTYTLGFPNAEVKNGFWQFVTPNYCAVAKDRTGFHIGMFHKELKVGDVDAFLTRLRSFFGNIPYDLNDQTERHYHVVFYLVFTLLGQYVQSEVKSAQGRSDAVVQTPDAVYVFEFKLNGTAEEALAQIDAKGYLIPYAASGKKLVKVGVEFDKTSRNLGRWLSTVV
jgi:hypothetical protein